MLDTSLLPTTPRTSTGGKILPLRWEQPELIFLAAGFLVCVPVFVQAPLVRYYPLVSLFLTAAWWGLGKYLMRKPKLENWGDLVVGFSWCWLAGSIYWGWLRYEPLLHLPVEAIGLPFAIWGLMRGRGKVGNLFYLGSLIGTVLTDVYFYLTGVIPFWRQLMTVELEPELVGSIFQSALAQIQNPWGISWAIVLLNLLLGVGIYSLQKRVSYCWAFSGAVLSTILVDGLFWVLASIA